MGERECGREGECERESGGERECVKEEEGVCVRKRASERKEKSLFLCSLSDFGSMYGACLDVDL